MKLWIDDVRPAPEGYVWRKSVNAAKRYIKDFERMYETFKLDKIEVIDIDHDAGNFVYDGGDYIKLLDWLIDTPLRPTSLISIDMMVSKLII